MKYHSIPPNPNLRILLAILAMGLFGMSTIQAQETLRDNFSDDESYNTNNGTLDFAGPWVETNETTDPENGRIYIDNDRLYFTNLDNRSIARPLDLQAATSATLTLDYQEVSGNETILVQLWDGTQYNTRATLNGSGSVNYTLTAAERNANASIRFITGSGNWGSSEEYWVDNVLFTATVPASVVITDITVDEGAAVATFTATHLGQPTALPFTVTWQTADGTALAGTEYVSNSGIMSFNGTLGDTETIVISLTAEDNIYELTEDFFIQMLVVSDPTVTIADQGIGNITDNEVILGNTPLTLFLEFDGYMDYTSTGGTLRTQPNTGDHCAITGTSSNTLTSAIPGSATIDQAILYWSNSADTSMDPVVTFEGQTINAELVYQSAVFSRNFFNHSADVTALVQAVPNPTTNVWDFSGLTIQNTGGHCSGGTVMGGWSLFIFYTDASLPASTINLYQGFDANQNATTSFGLSGFYAIGSVGAKTTILSWEGDQTLANNESLRFITPSTGSNLLTGDGDNTTGANPFNSTHFDNVGIPTTNNTNSHGVDLDTYDVSAFILPGETTATTQVNVGQDLVFMNLVVLKVPSNIIVGTVFEDTNYGGGPGRDQITAGGIGIPNATVELYDGTSTLIDTFSTDAAGSYDFAGMANGSYSVRVVNNTVRSTRPNGSGCSSCWPVQTYKVDYAASAVTPDPNKVGGENPAGQDPGAGILAGAQSISNVTILNEGAAGMDFGFNFNTIVNTNIDGQGSLEQFIINSNEIGETGLDIVANAIFDPAAGEDTSIFMIPPTADPLGRTADMNYTGGYFDISLTAGDQFSKITGDNTHIDGRTQTAYSGDSNTGTVGASGANVGVGAITLPDFDRPEIQIYEREGDPLTIEGNNFELHNTAVYSDARSAILVDGGTVGLYSNLIGVGADGAASANLEYGVKLKNGTVIVDGNYIAQNKDAGILIDGGTSTLIQNNHITLNGNDKCDPNISLKNGNGITILSNFIDNAAANGIADDGVDGNVTISQNSITTSGQDGNVCEGGAIANAGILLEGDDSTISFNMLYANGGPGIVLRGGNSSGNLITQNSIYANGTTADALGIDLDDSDNMGDGPTLNDNGDTDNGPNGRMNFPIIESAYIQGNSLVIRGWARPGTAMEFFMTDINEGTASSGDNELGMVTDYGEGQVYIGTVVEGSGSDLDATSSAYSDADGNTDNTNRFHVIVALPVGVTVGDQITATGTLANSTSEFSPIMVIKVNTVITNRRITYRVNKS